MRGAARRIVLALGQRLWTQDPTLAGRCSSEWTDRLSWRSGELSIYCGRPTGCGSILRRGAGRDHRPTQLRLPGRRGRWIAFRGRDFDDWWHDGTFPGSGAPHRPGIDQAVVPRWRSGVRYTGGTCLSLRATAVRVHLAAVADHRRWIY